MTPSHQGREERATVDSSGSATVSPNGEIVIPKAMRDRAGLQPGATVFPDQAADGTIAIEHAWNSVMDAPAYFARFPVVQSEEGRTSLDILHALDAEDEAIRDRKLGRGRIRGTSS